ncbi:MAG: CBS domain-containing protein [Chlorobi bacterium]|nr:CBS domain-containing protein [Chlorobiota bacterium]
MGDFNVTKANSPEEIAKFTKYLLRDVQALEYMLKNNWFDSGDTHIGAEQEFCLIDENYKPYPHNLEIIAEANMDNLSPELAKFNLETNVTPQKFTGKALSNMEKEILTDLNKVRQVAKKHKADIIITGILPTIRKFDVESENITPIPRYFALMDALKEMRGEEFIINISGIDELNMKLDSGLIEAANTGFQVHLQVSPANFAKRYNIAQAIAGIVLAPAVNSPLLFGKRLWRETRIALFQQAIDTRVSSEHIRDRYPRVTFGTKWVEESILDIYKEDIIRYRVLLGAEIPHDSLEYVKQGKVPILKALTVHNSTIYRWNRPVYGISPNGKPHLRIEARMFPAGPSVADEMANAAFWLGLMEGYFNRIDDIRKYVKFEDVKDNFYSAAQTGLGKRFKWFNGKSYYVDDLILNEMLDVAREGLEARQIDKEDIDHYLGIIRERVKKSQTGASWQLNTFSKFRDSASREEIMTLLTSSSVKYQKKDIPVHKWKLPKMKELAHWHPSQLLVEEVMETDVLSVQPNDIVDLVADMMDWAKLRYVPVEHPNGEFAGLVTARSILKYLRQAIHEKEYRDLRVKDLMITDPIIIEPYEQLKKAVELMAENNIGSLPVVHKGKLVGMLTETEFFHLSRRLFNRL